MFSKVTCSGSGVRVELGQDSRKKIISLMSEDQHLLAGCSQRELQKAENLERMNYKVKKQTDLPSFA